MWLPCNLQSIHKFKTKENSGNSVDFSANLSRHSENSKMKEDTRKRPLFFFELGASHKELLMDGYKYVGENRFSVSTTAANGTTFSATAAKDRDGTLEGVRALYNHNGTNINFKLDSLSLQEDLINSTRGKLSLTKQFLPSTTAKAVFSYRNYVSSNFRMWFLHQNATLWMSATRGPFPFGPRVSLAATTGTPSITFGIKMEVTKIIPRIRRPHWTAIVQVTRPAWDAYMHLECHKFRASYLHYLDDANKIAAGLMIPIHFYRHEIDFLAGGSWAIDHQTTVKARIDRHGKLEALLHHKINEKARLTVSGEFDMKNLNKKPGIWVALALDL